MIYQINKLRKYNNYTGFAALSDVVAGCVAGDPRAWSTLWALVEKAVSAAIFHTISVCGADPSLADDLRQEVFLHLRADDAARLHRFRGSTAEELRAFARVVASRLAAQRLRRWQHARAREAAAARRATAASGAGPTVAQVQFAMRELESAMSAADSDGFRRLCDWDRRALAEERPPRALRRLRERLYRKYAGRII